MGLIAAILQPIILYGYAFCGTVWVVLYLVIGTLLYPTKPFWKVKQRSIPPKCLNDPILGTHGYITVNNLKLHYVEKGDKSKTLMLFIHGFPEFWYSWRQQIKEFSKDYWTVAIDMRGFGDSDKPEGKQNYKVDIIVDDIKKMITSLGREKCILVGHDWGGVVAWRFVATHPEMLQSYIILNAPFTPKFSKVLASNKQQLRMSWYVFFFQLPYLPEVLMRSFDLIAFDNIYKKASRTLSAVNKDDIEAYKYVFGKPGAFTAPINYYRANFNLKRSKEQKNVFEPPGLFMFGEKDNYLVLDHLKIAKEYVKNLEVEVIKGAGHFVQQDASEKVNKLMRNFLAIKS